MSENTGKDEIISGWQIVLFTTGFPRPAIVTRSPGIASSKYTYIHWMN